MTEIDHIVRVERVKPSDMEELITNAKADDHYPLRATHVVRLHGEIVGYFSIGAVASLNLWLHSEKVHSRNSLHALTWMDDRMKDLNIETYSVTLPDKAPYRPFMEKLGFSGGVPGFYYFKDAK